MSNFGFFQLRVVNPYDVAFREARSAMGASRLLEDAVEYKSVASAVADCNLVVGTTAARDRDLQHPLRPLPIAARIIRQRLPSEKVALLFGSEKYGLSNDDMSYCHWLLRIPTRDEHPSMNLGQAVAVCLYEMSRSKNSARRAGRLHLASGRELDRFSDVLLDSLKMSGYIKKGATGATEEKLRRLLRRQKLSSDDAELWLGMLRQIAWKLRTGEAGPE